MVVKINDAVNVWKGDVMIFNSCCENILWLILSGDEKNRNLIYEFINSIPIELMEKINDGLNRFNEYEYNKVSVLERESDLLVGLFISGAFSYLFNIDMVLGILEIERNFNGENDIKIAINLNSKIILNGNQSLGYVDIGDSKRVTYELISNVFGDNFVCSSNGRVKKYKKVDIENIGTVVLNKRNKYTRCKCKRSK